MRLLRVLPAAFWLLTTACVWQGDAETPMTATTPPTTTSTVPVLPGPDEAAATETALAFLDAWTRADLATMRALSPDAPGDLGERHAAWRDALGVVTAGHTVVTARAADAGVEVVYRADLRLRGAGPWSYEGSILVAPDGDGWTIPWSPGLIHPSLEPGDELVLERLWPTRAPILGANGITLVTDRAVKVIGVVPQRIDDIDILLPALEDLTGIPPASVTRELEKPGVQPDWWLPVGWMPVIDYLPIQASLGELEGVEVRDDMARLGPASPFADHVLGTTGPITAELLGELGEPYRAGDIVGLTGLERAMEPALAGYPSFEVQRVNQFGRVVEVLHKVPGAAATAVRTTLEVDTQLAAEVALESVELPSALVVVDAATGEVRAMASRPLGGFNRALAGLYPPGSTFKVITAASLLTAGLDPADPVDCPATVLIGGREYRNASERELGEIPLAVAFAESCNTTFAALAAETLGLDGLGEAAADFGFGVFYETGLPSPAAEIPDPPEIADVAAAAIGQGGVQVTPLHQATVAAAVADGTWRPPQLAEGASGPAPVPLDPLMIADLTSMMELVVTEGTGTGAAVEGQSVYGKTGSAEFAEDQPTHAWFIGFWEGLGIAAVVEGGGAGGEAAAPIVASFVGQLSSRGG